MNEDLRSSRSVSPDEAFPPWAVPIAACVRNFKGGTLIVNSAPFRDALVEAERIWVEENIDYKTEEDKFQPPGQRDNITREDKIAELESELERLRLEKRDVERGSGAGNFHVPHPMEINTARPEDVAELLSEIYNTEWQPAFEYFIYKKKVREREAAEELLKILQECYDFCEKLSEEHLRDLTETLFVPTSNQHLLKKIRVPNAADITSQHITSDLNRLRTSANTHIFPVVEQLFFLTEKHHLKAYIKTEKLQPFISLCVKCAWISSVQDRQLSITFKLNPGSNFYPDVMISRNTPAPEVDYLVWPIVFKYDNGPLLLKGIVHCSQLK